MMPLLTNARNVRLDQGGASPVPSVATSLYGILEPVTFVIITKRQNTVTFEVEETRRPFPTMASVQPLTVRELSIKAEGERRWTWLKVYALTDVILQPKDVIELGDTARAGTPYRVMAAKDWRDKGQMYYELVADYEIPAGYDS